MKSDKNEDKSIKCAHCQKLVPKTPFCIFCGAKLDITATEIPDLPELIVCPHCNTKVPKTTYCISCGRQFDPISTQKPVSKTVSETQKCPLCRQEVPTTHNFCHLCGGRLKKKEGETEKEIFCTRCWKPNPPETEYCIHCGLNRQVRQSKILEEPFEGFQLDLSNFFQQYYQVFFCH